LNSAETERTRGSEPSTLIPEILHVQFGGHCVTVSSALPAVTVEFRSAFGPMLARGPTGAPAGHLEVIAVGDGIRILGSEFADSPPTEDPAEAARELFHAAVKLLMLARQDLVWLHAGVAALGDRAYVFCGPSGQGKSTLVGALLDRGWTYFSDEIAAIDATAGVVHPFPITPHRRVSEGALLEDVEDVRRLPKIAVDLPPAAVGRRPIPIAGVYFLRYEPTASAILESPCSPAQAVLEMLQNSLSISTDREREIELLARLVSQVSITQVTYARPEEAASRVDAAVSARPA
jgi:hypothetical protein